MRVNSHQLKEGCILLRDIKLQTNTTFMKKKTILDSHLIEAIQAFLIEEVDIEPNLADGTPFDPTEDVSSDSNVQPRVQKTFVEYYHSAVQEYKRLFQSWQAGAPVDIPKIRQQLQPLLEKAVDYPSDTLRIHHFSEKHEYIFHHAVAVGAISALLAHKLKFPKGEWLQIGYAGALADCGMAKIDNKILNKQTSLTFDEFNEVKQHPTYSYEMLKQVTILRENVRIGVYQHHERIDGSGYPQGLKGDQLHPYGKIIAVADAFHAMTSERAYKSKQSPFKVLEVITWDSFGKFDLKVVQALTELLTSFSTGTFVKLSNSQVGEIVFIEQQHPTRPMVKLISGEIIQLSKRYDLFIEDVLK